jgi:ADP-heptose:LPS heptosyltransferase
MGDIILTTPLLRTLNEAFPAAKITYLAETPYLSLLENHPFVHERIPFDFKTINKMSPFEQARAHFQFINTLRRPKFDLAFDLFGNPRSALQVWLSGARYRIGGDFPGRGKLYNLRVDYQNLRLNAIQFHLKTLEPLGIAIPQHPFTEIFTTPEEDRRADEFLKSRGLDPGQPLIGIHPGATWPAKMWFRERFAELIQRIQTELKLQVLLTHGPGEEMRITQIRQTLNQNIAATGVLSLRELAAVLKKFSVYISNDCGPLHLAVAVRTKTLGIFGPGEPDIWFPYDAARGHRFLHKPPACWPCHLDFCESLDCMRAISVAEVFATLTQMLQNNEVFFR